MGLFDSMQADAASTQQPVSLLDQMRADAKAQLAAGGAPVVPGVKAPSTGLVMGSRDPIDAGAQLLRRAVPDSVGNAVDSVGNWLADKGLPVTRSSGVQGVDQIVKGVNADYDKRRREEAQTLSGVILGKQPEPGFDWGRAVGNVLSPANLALAARLPAAATLIGRVGTGALAGAVGGALQPATGDNFWTEKAAQTGLGAGAGAVMSPAIGAIANKAVTWLAGRGTKAIDLSTLDTTLRQIAADSGQKWEDMSPAIQGQLRQQTIDALSAGKGASPAALARASDFAAEGMQPTLGQVTRDAGQFATERNLRTMPGVGDPLLQRFQAQGQQLQNKVGAYAEGASDKFNAGQKLADALMAYDSEQSAAVRSAYGAARNSAGKDAEVPLQGLAQDYAQVLDSFGDKVPSGVRNQFVKFGIDPANPSNLKKVFNVEEADKLLKIINENQSNDPATNAALARLRTSVKNAVTQDAGVDDVFAPARKLAAQRFAMQDAVPAIQAASTGSTAPDDFVNRFIINGKTQQVQKLAEILKASSPETAAEAKAQIGATLQRAAYGENVAGDKAFSPERYAKALRDMGDDKLSAFFSPDEMTQIHRVSRIGAYINSVPNAAPVQSSNNWGAIMGVASHIPGVKSVTGLVSGVKNVVNNQNGVARALSAEVPQAAPEMSPEQVRLLAKLLAASSGGAGAATAQKLQE